MLEADSACYCSFKTSHKNHTSSALSSHLWLLADYRPSHVQAEIMHGRLGPYLISPEVADCPSKGRLIRAVLVRHSGIAKAHDFMLAGTAPSSCTYICMHVYI